MIALVDCNNFFVSCERVFRPDLQNVPVAVLSSNDGCVIARSNEIKAIGVKMGMPYFKCKDLIERCNGAVFSTNFRLYGDLSNRVFNTVREFSDSVEIYSIDEAFIDFSGLEKIYDLTQFSKQIRYKIFKNVGIPTSVGVAPTKTLAKIATNIAKKFPQLNSVHVIDSQLLREKALKWTPIEDVWGIGRQSVKKLKKYGVNTAWDFIQKSDAWVNKFMHKPGLDIKHELEGTPSIDLQSHSAAKQSISVSRTFAKPKYELEELEAAVVDFTTLIAKKLRAQNSVAKQITVFANSNRFAEIDFVYSTFTIDLPVGTSSSIELVKFSKIALLEFYKKGIAYKRAGVVVTKLSDSSTVQGNLFDNLDRDKHSKLMKSLDSINTQIGKSSLKLASESKTGIHTKSTNMSPDYTTDWNQILEVSCE